MPAWVDAGQVRELMVSTEFLGGCPVLAVAVEGADDEAGPPVLKAAADAFTLWENLLAESLREHGVAEQRAAHLATLVIAALEGGVAMCRAKRNIEPLDNLTQPLRELVASAIPCPVGDPGPS
jgi:hypothetical protein